MRGIIRRWREQLKSADSQGSTQPISHHQLAVLWTSAKAMHMYQQQKFKAEALGWLKVTGAVCCTFTDCLLSQRGAITQLLLPQAAQAPCCP